MPLAQDDKEQEQPPSGTVRDFNAERDEAARQDREEEAELRAAGNWNPYGTFVKE